MMLKVVRISRSRGDSPLRAAATLLFLGVLTSACANPSPAPSARSLASVGVPTPLTPSPSAHAACQAGQLALTPGREGAAAGTAYLTVFVELSQGPPCSIPQGPSVSIMGPHGVEIARSSENVPTPVLLDTVLIYHIGWSSDCRTLPAGAFTARVDFGAGLSVAVPVGDFRPTTCMNPEGQTLFMDGAQ